MGRRDERVPLCTQGSSTLGSPAATKAGVKCEMQRQVIALVLFGAYCRGREPAVLRQECLLSVEALGSPAGLGGQRQVLYRSLELLLCG